MILIWILMRVRTTSLTSIRFWVPTRIPHPGIPVWRKYLTGGTPLALTSYSLGHHIMPSLVHYSFIVYLQRFFSMLLIISAFLLLFFLQTFYFLAEYFFLSFLASFHLFISLLQYVEEILGILPAVNCFFICWLKYEGVQFSVGRRSGYFA